MRISPAAEFAIRGLLVLAERHGRAPTSMDTVCAERGLAKQYMSKIFAALVRAGLVVPVRGKHGGYRLAREPRKITLLEVVEAVDGPVVLNFCQQSPPQCTRSGCRVRPVWEDLQKAIRGKLSTVTLADGVGG